MGKSLKHKLKGKYNTVLDYSEDPAPIELQKMWNRHNFDLGESRRDKKQKRIKDLNKDLKDDLCTHRKN
jgi:hypothetical protein